MAFGINTILTNLGKALISGRLVSNATLIPGYIAIGTGATLADRTASATDTALSTEVQRQASTLSTVTTTTTDDTFQSQSTFTAGAHTVVDEVGLFDAASAGNLFLSITSGVNTLEIGDQIQVTCKVISS
jgi:hypothetical protein